MKRVFPVDEFRVVGGVLVAVPIWVSWMRVRRGPLSKHGL